MYINVGGVPLFNDMYVLVVAKSGATKMDVPFGRTYDFGTLMLSLDHLH